MYNAVDYSQLLDRRWTGHIYQQHVKKEAFILTGMHGVQSAYRRFFEYARLSVDSLSSFASLK
jgi:hypothetical protein